MGSCGMSGESGAGNKEIWKPDSAMLGGLGQAFLPPRASVSLTVPGNNDGGRGSLLACGLNH